MSAHVRQCKHTQICVTDDRASVERSVVDVSK